MKRSGEENVNSSQPQKKHKHDRSHHEQASPDNLPPSQQSELNTHLRNRSDHHDLKDGLEALAQLPQANANPRNDQYPPQKSHKSHKHQQNREDHDPRKDRKNHHGHNDQRDSKDRSKLKAEYEEALAQLPPRTSQPGPVPAYTRFTVSASLPPLPPINDTLASAPFTHRSTSTSYHRTQTTPDLTYERLEFLGDAYIELFASRLLLSRFGYLTAGQLSQLRELLVKNETLAEFSRLYGFESRVSAGNMEMMHEESKAKGNKGFNKVLGDVFEAYVAAVILSDAEEGFAVAEVWLTGLWAPKLVEAVRRDASYAPLIHDKSADPLKLYDPAAKVELQRRIFAGNETKLEYEKFQDSVELKGEQLGQNRHFIALYLTGYGYERKLLGKGEGKNKVEAGNWAAIQAMYGECKDVVEECEKKLQAAKAERRKARDGR